MESAELMESSLLGMLSCLYIRDSQLSGGGTRATCTLKAFSCFLDPGTSPEQMFRPCFRVLFGMFLPRSRSSQHIFP